MAQGSLPRVRKHWAQGGENALVVNEAKEGLKCVARHIAILAGKLHIATAIGDKLLELGGLT